jgi:hypothetical protein
MNLLLHLLSPGIIGVVAVFLSIVWMLRNEQDRTRPLLVFALILNLFYGWLLTVVLGRENSLLPSKYDYVLIHIDAALGVSTAAIALQLQTAWRIPLIVVYQLMVPMMIVWFLAIRDSELRKSLILTYVAELVAGPVMYAILPACGPVYAFGAHWLHPPLVQAQPVQFNGMPNAFPSLHVGTAFVLLLFATGKLRQAIALVFLAATVLATLATGEHYFIDLIPGLAFGCFAANAGFGKVRCALFYLALVLGWSLSVRLASSVMIANPILVKSLAALTVCLAAWEAIRQARTTRVGRRMVAKAESP